MCAYEWVIGAIICASMAHIQYENIGLFFFNLFINYIIFNFFLYSNYGFLSYYGL